jgi:hypothetical protein
MEAIKRAVFRGQWDRFTAPKPCIVVHLDVDEDTEEVCLRCYPNTVVTVGADGSTVVGESNWGLYSLSIFRMLGCRHPMGGAYLFEASLEEYAACSGRYDAAVGLVGDIGNPTSSRVRIRIWGDEQEGDCIVVVAPGELRPIWRRVTLLPSVNQRFSGCPAAPATFEVHVFGRA